MDSMRNNPGIILYVIPIALDRGAYEDGQGHSLRQCPAVRSFVSVVMIMSSNRNCRSLQ